MNWKEEAAQRLGDYRYMRNAQGSIHREIKRLEKEAAALKSLNLDVVCTPNAPGRKEDRLLNNLVRRQQLEDSLEQVELWIDATDTALDCLKAEERQVLDRIYIHGDWGSATELAADLGLERSSLYRRRDDALRKFTVALYGKS